MTDAIPQKVDVPDSAVPPGDPDYAAKMIARAGAATAPQDDTTNAPAPEPTLLAGKFKDVAALEQAYAELHKKLGQQSNAPKPNEAPAASANPDPTNPDLDVKPKAEPEGEVKAAEEAVHNAGLDWGALNTEFATNGKLGDEAYAKLEKSGIPRELVDQFIDGQIARRDASRAAVFTEVGGEEVYGNMIQWAAENMSPAEINAYNSIVNGRDVGATKIAVAGLKAKFDAAGGTEPNLIGGGSGDPAGYKSVLEMKRDMADPRYEKDPAFRREVENKLRASRF